jgi:antitoxin HicB
MRFPGPTRVEATENIREAIEGYLKSLRRVARKHDALLHDSLFDRRTSLVNEFLRSRHGCSKFNSKRFRTLPGGWRVSALVECWVMKYRVYLEPDEDGVFVATCPALPGCVSQGRTRMEATENIREAIEGYLKSLRKHGDPVPPSIIEEVIEVSGG